MTWLARAVLSPLAPYIMGAVLVALSLGAWRINDRAFDRGYAASELAWQAKQQAALAAAQAQENERDEITYYSGLNAAERQQEIQSVTATNIQLVPFYVSEKADAGCTIPLGFVRLHDAAASGVAATAIPEAPAESHDTPSGIELSSVASTVTGNYGLCEATRQQLIDLQNWITAQAGVGSSVTP